MENGKYEFQVIPRLNLFDMKAQKKTISYKKLRSLPLTVE